MIPVTRAGQIKHYGNSEDERLLRDGMGSKKVFLEGSIILKF